MATAIDVLAVLSDLVGDTPGTTGHQVAQVLDAVVELIEADKAYDAALAADASAEAGGDDDLICNAGRQLQWAKDRRANALARVGGA